MFRRFVSSGRNRVLAGLALVALLAAPLSANAIPVRSQLDPAGGQPVEAPVHPAGLNVLPEGVPQEGCQPDPLEVRLQKLRCRYGPIVVTPGSNLILLGPVSIEEPRAEGFMLKMRPNMVDAATGTVPPIHEVHLHHGVWLEASQDPANSIDVPFMAAGEEKTVSTPPVHVDPVTGALSGYGYRLHTTNEWVLNYMIHNLTSRTYQTFITYDLDWMNANSPLATGLTSVKPVWWDTAGGFYPVYDPYEGVDPGPNPADHVRRRDFGVKEAMELVWMAGHVHPGGKRIDITTANCGDTAPNSKVFTSSAIPNDRGGQSTYGSWDYLMGAANPNWRFTMYPGDRVHMDTVYDAAHPWYEAMGIVFGWGVPLSTPGYVPTSARCQPPAAGLVDGIRSNVFPAPPVFGGTTEIMDDPSSYSVAGQAPVNEIDIANFNYSVGGTAQPPAPVKAGSDVIVKNLDFAASVYHTITSCADACNKDTGQAYPLASWKFDSKQLGYGIYGATAAQGGVYPPFLSGQSTGGLPNDPQGWASGDPLRHVVNRTDAYQWTWKIPADAAVGQTLPYFCRVHPFMRGSVQVVEGA